MRRRSVFDASALAGEFEKAEISPKFIPIIWKHVTQNPFCELSELPSLPAVAYPMLCSKFKPLASSVYSVIASSDEVTTKLLINLEDGAFVETVVMRHDSSLGRYGGNPRPGGPRATLCISSQGMGEPLNNYSALVESIRIMTRPPFCMSTKRITVSTVGIIHSINKLQEDVPNVNLAVSLHAPVQDIRCRIMPAARAFPLEKLMSTLNTYQQKSRQKIFVEYIMLDGVNDEERNAHQLGNLLDKLEVVVNLIPFNPIENLNHFRTSSADRVKSFQKIMRGCYNIRTTIRKQMGQDISGACGQLAVKLPQNKSKGSAGVLTDIEDLHL